MPRSGSGTYTLPAPYPSGFSNGTTIDAPTMNTVLTDVQSAMTASVAADGQTPITGNFNWATKNITNVGTLGASAIASTNITNANNTVSLAYFVGDASGPTWTRGTGAPVAVQPNASIYLRTDGGTGTRVYVSAGAGVWAPIPGV